MNDAQHEKRRRKYTPDSGQGVQMWSKDVDPAVMSGQHWERAGVKPDEQDIGWRREENEELKHRIPPAGEMFMHPVHDVSYDAESFHEEDDNS
jgi:hypothetical protein